tara:strand:- start:628 stop:849 length:222 start_codon:yes stop_codon:yes gene_type:complete
MSIQCHITRTSVLTGQTMYFVEGQKWSDDFSRRKIFPSLTAANATIAPTTRIIGGAEVSNANGGFKNATVVHE